MGPENSRSERAPAPAESTAGESLPETAARAGPAAPGPYPARRALAWSAALAVACAVAHVAVLLPYRLFPSDDRWFLDAERWSRYPMAPAYFVWLAGLSSAWALVSADARSALAVSTALANAACVFLCAWVVLRQTGRAGIAAATGLSLAVSPWTLTYGLMASYAPFAAALELLALALGLEGRLADGAAGAGSPGPAPEALASPPGSPGATPVRSRPALVALAAAGVVLGGHGLSSAVAPVSSRAVLIVTALVFPSRPARGRATAVAVVALWAAAVVTPYFAANAGPWIDHLHANARRGHGAEWAEIHGRPVPASRVPAALVVGRTHIPVQLAAFTLLAIALAWRMRPGGPPATGGASVVAALVAGVVAHVALVELLPFTKLGRSFFGAFPPMLLALALAAAELAGERTTGSRRRTTATAAAAALVGALVVALARDTRVSSDLISSRQVGRAYLDALRRRADLFALSFDAHAGAIEGWIDAPIPRVDEIAGIEGRPGRAVALVLGPHGPGSGLGVVRHGALPPLDLRRLRPHRLSGVRVRLLPFYAHVPAFLVEEETCQALHAAGEVPDHRLERLHVTVLEWTPGPRQERGGGNR
jgi:hypothetical protein